MCPHFQKYYIPGGDVTTQEQLAFDGYSSGKFGDMISYSWPIFNFISPPQIALIEFIISNSRAFIPKVIKNSTKRKIILFSVDRLLVVYFHTITRIIRHILNKTLIFCKFNYSNVKMNDNY